MKKQALPTTLKQLRKFFAGIPKEKYVMGSFGKGSPNKCAIGHYRAAFGENIKSYEQLEKLVPASRTNNCIDRIIFANDSSKDPRAGVLKLIDRLIDVADRKKIRLAKKVK